MGLFSPRTGLLVRCAYTTLRSPPTGACHGKRLLLQQPCFRNDFFGPHVRAFRKTRLPGGESAPLRASPLEAELQLPPSGPISGDKIWKAACFTAVFCGGCFVATSIWHYEVHHRRKGSMFDIFHGQRTADEYGFQHHRKAGAWRTKLHSMWMSLSPGERAFLPICAANLLVWMAWRVPAWRGLMVRYFTASPGQPSTFAPMVLSVFSHYSFLHLFVNMYVLHSFSNAIVHSMGREQFFGFYLSAGVFSSLASHIYKVVVKLPGLSLGASGAIMGVVGYVCTVYPDIRLAIIFLPMYSFSAEQALKGVVLFDTLGAVFKWAIFDHAAHLGGAFFGVFYAYYYNAIIRRRERLMSSWHSFRTGLKRSD